MVGHDGGDGDLGDPHYAVVGHKVHGQGNHGHGDGVHGDGVHGGDVYGGDAHEEEVHEDGVHGGDAHEEGVHGDGAYWNYDYEGVRGSYWCQNGDDDILTLERAKLGGLLPEMVVCLIDFCLLEEEDIQVHVACGDGHDL